MYPREPNSEVIEEHITPGVAVHAERQTGKSTALLRMMGKERNGAIVVASQSASARYLETLYQETLAPVEFSLFRRSKRPNCPRFVTGGGLQLRGVQLPIYVDEWWLLSPNVQREIIESGQLKGAVGTVPHATPIPLVLPKFASKFESVRFSLYGCVWTKEQAAILKDLIDTGTMPDLRR